MPLLAAVATRARGRGPARRVAPATAAPNWSSTPIRRSTMQGRFAGFHARDPPRRRRGRRRRRPPVFEDSLDEALRSPLARIISAADHIVERGDGPLRSDYANYASDIAAAGRHLLSVIRAMGQGDAAAAQRIDLEQLAAKRSGWSSRSPTSAASPSPSAAPTRPAGRGRGARRRPDPRQHHRQCGAPLARRRQRRGAVRARRRRMPRDDRRPGAGDRARRPAAHLRALRTRRHRARRQRARPRHLAPPGALDGRRHHAATARPARARASPWSCPPPSASPTGV